MANAGQGPGLVAVRSKRSDRRFPEAQRSDRGADLALAAAPGTSNDQGPGVALWPKVPHRPARGVLNFGWSSPADSDASDTGGCADPLLDWPRFRVRPRTTCPPIADRRGASKAVDTRGLLPKAGQAAGAGRRVRIVPDGRQAGARAAYGSGGARGRGVSASRGAATFRRAVPAGRCGRPVRRSGRSRAGAGRTNSRPGCRYPAIARRGRSRAPGTVPCSPSSPNPAPQ